MSTCVDLTEFLTRPHRTGIQRVTGELCLNWPQSIPLTPVMFVAGKGLVELPQNVLRSIGDYFSGESDRPPAALLSAVNRAEKAAAIAPSGAVLVPEVFYDPHRITFFRNMPAAQRSRLCFIVYDLLPLTHPHYFPADAPVELISNYFALIRDAAHVGFISEYTRSEYYGRLKRTEIGNGPVLRLGSDGLGPRGSSGPVPKPTFVMTGTIEPRKRHELVLDSFEPLFERVPDLDLVFLGRLGWVEAAFAERVRRTALGRRQFRLIDNPSDSVLVKHVRNARATLFLSTAEGFGLPPVESLWLGTPVIASTGVPSLETIGNQGICRVTTLDAEGVRQAVMELLNDGNAMKKREEALRVPLPTWGSFGEQVASWVSRAAA